MKKFLTIVVLFLLLCNPVIAKNLTGVQLKCTLSTMEKYLEFISEKRVTEWDFMPSQIKLFRWDNFYRADIKKIEFSFFSDFKSKMPSALDRETLEYGSYDCEIIKNFDIESYLNNEMEKLTEEQNDKNKL